MKKLFISCPVTGRKLEDIVASREKMLHIAEIVFEQGFEVIDCGNFVEEMQGFGVEDLANHIKKLADADYFIGVSGWWDCWGHIQAEHAIAKDYMRIPVYVLDPKYIAPDLEKVEREHRNEHCVCDAVAPAPCGN